MKNISPVPDHPVMLAVKSEISGREGSPLLAMRCDVGGTFWVYVHWQSAPILEFNRAISYRFDDGPMITAEWLLSGNRLASYVPWYNERLIKAGGVRNAREFAQTMAASQRLRVEAVVGQDIRKTAEFDLTDTQATLDKMVETCGDNTVESKLEHLITD